MGEYEQPIVGMKCCRDLEWDNEEWCGREWFVVRRAEIQISEDNVLIPQVKMGVEAREQVMSWNGLIDRPLTNAKNPLVKYAQEFTDNFDLIAERKSAIFHLRELAKASVLAKYLLEAKVELDDVWLGLAGRRRRDEHFEIPQLWNERILSRIQVQDGKIMDSKEASARKGTGVYGGVQFGLERFKFKAAAPVRAARAPPAMAGVSLASLRSTFAIIASMSAVPPEAPAPEAAAPGAAVAAVSAPGAVAGLPRMMGAPGVQVGPAPTKPSARFPLQLAQQMRLAMPPGSAMELGLQMSRPSDFQLQGVDLNLDSFDLAEAVQVKNQAGSWAGDEVANATIASAFWSSLDSDSPVFSAEDRELLRKVFNPSLSDRRDEGEVFAPPNPSPEYIDNLRCLVEREETVQEQRRGHFLSNQFVADEPGPLFPHSWASTSQVTNGAAPQEPAQSSSLQPRPDYLARAETFEHVLQTATPVFDNVTEDGLRFRIYKHGHLDVRTIQEQGGKEVIGAIFMAGSLPRSPARWGQAQDQDKVTKVTEYVEIVDNLLMGENIMGNTYFHSYVVIETARGDAIVTEKLADGSAVWDENPGNIEERNSLAKCIRSSDCGQGRGASATVGDIKAYMRAEGPDASHSACKKYTQAVYSIILGLRSIDSGFGDKSGWNKAEKKAQALKKKKAAERREAAAAAKAARSRG